MGDGIVNYALLEAEREASNSAAERKPLLSAKKYEKKYGSTDQEERKNENQSIRTFLEIKNGKCIVC